MKINFDFLNGIIYFLIHAHFVIPYKKVLFIYYVEM